MLMDDTGISFHVVCVLNSLSDANTSIYSEQFYAHVCAHMRTLLLHRDVFTQRGFYTEMRCLAETALLLFELLFMFLFPYSGSPTFRIFRAPLPYVFPFPSHLYHQHSLHHQHDFPQHLSCACEHVTNYSFL